MGYRSGLFDFTTGFSCRFVDFDSFRVSDKLTAPKAKQ
jgi:hypothetical protein